MKLWICEKPSQAESLANELGNNGKKSGFFETSQGLVTWAFGHLLHIAPPEYYDKSLEFWSFSKLPIVPKEFILQASPDSEKQLNIIGNLLAKANEIVIATDGDREGEAIARNLLSHFDFTGNISRLWLGALDPTSIQKALSKIKDGSETEALYQAALARSHADWLIGMNGTMAATVKLSQGGVVSLGRVQTPTLKMIVNRDLAVDKFEPRNFYEFVGEFQVGDNENLISLRYAPTSEKRIFNATEAKDIKKSLLKKDCVFSVECKRKKETPPKLFSLSGLQIEANNKWGWSADKTLKVAQALYETHKVTTYPRSDCTFLPEEQKDDIQPILANLQNIERLSNVVSQLIKNDYTIRKSVFNTKKVTAHHAIIPTQKKVELEKLNADEMDLYMLISTHFIACLMPDYEYDETLISTTINEHNFKQSYSFSKIEGWHLLIPNNKKDASNLPKVSDNTAALVADILLDKKTTTPPKRYTEATLIKDMTNIAKYVAEDEYKATLKETSGIGTEATRASIITTLKERGVIEVKGKTLHSTQTGKTLIQALPDSVTSPIETALWEDELTNIASGTGSYSSFMEKVTNKLDTLLSDIALKSSQGVRLNTMERKPSDNMISMVQKLVKLTGEPCEDFEDDIVACRNYMDKHSSTLAAHKNTPSEKAISFAETIASKLNLKLPQNYNTSAEICSYFISEHKNNLPVNPPSEAQLKFALKIAKSAKQPLTDEIKASSKLCSQYITDNKSSLPKAKGKAKPKLRRK